MTFPRTVAPAPLEAAGTASCARPFLPERVKRLVGPRTERLMATAATALGLFVAARLCGVLVLAAAAHATGKSTFALLGRSWDSLWYLEIAVHGYGRTLHFEPGVIHSDLAFFPLYPGLVRIVTAVVPVSGGAAGLLVSWTAAMAAAWGMYRIGVLLHGHGTATLLVLLWGLLPHSVVLSMAYTEPVLTAFAAWSLYAVLTGRWLWAGVLATLAGASRPNGFAVAAAVIAAAGCEVWKRRGRVPHSLWTGAALAPAGWCAFVLWVGFRKGDPLGGYFAVQRGWGSRFDFGADSLVFVRHLLLEGDRVVFPVTMVIVAAGVLLYALLIADRAPLPLLVHSGVLLLITIAGSGFFESKPRFLLPAFPLLLPLACALARTARARPLHAVLVVGALAGLSMAYGTYLVAIAHTPL